ncbi:hypothetical protein C0995_010958 [Termitomyces sp. Mi166|nr:hypothetical protein C0995_010958 [Termitomyces sp. Mi166\
MPGMNETVKLHMDHMHDHLNHLVDDSLGVRFKFPDRVKPRHAEGKHIWTYSKGHKFSQLEDWAMDVCYHLAACCYGGDNMDQERIFALHEFIDGEAWNWFRCHVLHTNRDKQDWTFKEVLIELTAVYDAQTGVQTFYEELIGHAQNMAIYPDEFTIWETFLDGIPAEMHCALRHDDNLSPEVNTVTEFLAYAIRYNNLPIQQHIMISAALAAHRDIVNLQRLERSLQNVLKWNGTAICMRAAHTAAADSDAESNAEKDQEELVNDEEVPPEVGEPREEDDAESIHIDGDKYVTVDVYDNKYYARDGDEEHLFALTEYQGDRHVKMRRVTLQKAVDKLQQPQYTPQEKECLVIYVEVNRNPVWMLWDSGSTTMGITPQFAHVNAICVHELSEHLMLQLGTVGSHAMVQFGAEVKIKASGHLTKEYVDIANFDCYDMIIGTPYMRKNNVVLDFIKNEVVINRIPLKAERIVLADMDGHLRCHQTMEKRCDPRD